MKKIMFAVAFLTGTLLMLQGCDTDLGGGRYSGSSITFSSATGNLNTKTQYGGREFIENGYEAIQWVEGDVLRIYSPNVVSRYDYEHGTNSDRSRHWADYEISSVDNQGRTSKAKLRNPEGENGLVWGSNDIMSRRVKFFSVYPTPGNAEGAGLVDGTSGKFACGIPDVQEFSEEGNLKKFGYMVSKAEADFGSNVELDFEPAFSAFCFTFTSERLDIKLNSFTLASDSKRISGKYTIDMSGDRIAYDFRNATSNSIKVDLEGRELTPNTKLTFTVLALPQDFNDLMISFEMKTEEVPTAFTKTLKLEKADGTPVTFRAGQKYNITGVAVNADLWCFQSITLEGQADNWLVSPYGVLDSNNMPQATQFAVTGGMKNVYAMHPETGEDYRQHWVFDRDASDPHAVIDFNVFAPIGGKCEIVPCGATEKYEISPEQPSFIWSITDPRTSLTHITIKIRPNERNYPRPGEMVWFKVYVRDANDIVYSIDSETQLYDMRGYHYFRIDDPLE